MVEYDSKTVRACRKMQVYTPAGYSAEKRYPVLYLLHGIGLAHIDMFAWVGGFSSAPNTGASEERVPDPRAVN